jgi:hypothetical protein
LGVLALQLGEDFTRTVARPVIDAEQLEIDWYGEHFPDDFTQGSTLVVNRHYDREFHGNSAAV